MPHFRVSFLVDWKKVLNKAFGYDSRLVKKVVLLVDSDASGQYLDVPERYFTPSLSLPLVRKKQSAQYTFLFSKNYIFL